MLRNNTMILLFPQAKRGIHLLFVILITITIILCFTSSILHQIILVKCVSTPQERKPLQPPAPYPGYKRVGPRMQRHPNNPLRRHLHRRSHSSFSSPSLFSLAFLLFFVLSLLRFICYFALAEASSHTGLGRLPALSYPARGDDGLSGSLPYAPTLLRHRPSTPPQITPAPSSSDGSAPSAFTFLASSFSLFPARPAILVMISSLL